MINTLNTISASRPVASIFDEYIWGGRPAETLPEKPKVYLDFNTPPLALAIAMQQAGRDTSQIFDTLVGVGNAHRPILLEDAVSKEHQAEAAKIYNYFANKHTMRRLKGEHISDFMLVVDDLCENRKRIDLEHVKVLVTLPGFYEQNRVLENIMHRHNSVEKIDNVSFAAWHGEVKFVERVHIKTSRLNLYHYYFSTPKNYLMRITVQKHDYGASAWDTLAKLGKLHIDTEVVYTKPIRGYDFNVLEPAPSHMKINIA